MSVSTITHDFSAAELKHGETFESVGGITVTVASIEWTAELMLEAVATQDGRAVIAEWHTGEEADWVYFERYGAGGRVSHGWVDSASRKIVQTG